MNTVTQIDANAMIAQIRKDNPTRVFALSDNRTAVGVWSDALGRWSTVCGLCIDGQWVRVGDLLVNGAPVTTYRNSPAPESTGAA